MSSATASQGLSDNGPEGAISAFETVTGETWKAYVPTADLPSSVSRKSAAEQGAALGW